MIRNIKLGLVVAAVLAMSAIGASAAHAASSLDVGKAPAFLTGAQKTANKLLIGPAGERTTVKCTTSTLSGTTTTANVTEATLTPFYGGAGACTFAGLEMGVVINGCKYTLTNTATPLVAEVAVVSCTKPLEITQGACILKVPIQGPLGTITFKNEHVGGGATEDVLATLAVTSINTEGGAGCPANIQGVLTNGEITGTQTIQAFEDSSGVEGAQVSLKAT